MKKGTKVISLLLIAILLSSCARQDTPTQERTSKNTPKVTSEVVPKVTPEVTPNATPVEAPEVTQIVTPSVTPEDETEENDNDMSHYDFAVGANNINMNSNACKMVTDGKYLYACIPSDSGIFKGLLSECEVMNDTSINIADGGTEITLHFRDTYGEIDAIGVINDTLYVVEKYNELNMDSSSEEYGNYKTQYYTIDSDNNVELKDVFYKSDYDGMILGEWYYYIAGQPTIKSQTLLRRSLLDGTVEVIDNIQNAWNLYFTDDKLYYDKNSNAELKSYIMDLSTCNRQELTVTQASSIVGVYEGYIYYRQHADIMRIPEAGGEAELVVSHAFDGVEWYINIANDNLYYIWGNLLYVLPLDQIGVSRYDIEYTEMYPMSMTLKTVEDRGLWIWGEDIWTFYNPEGTNPTTLQIVQ